MRYLSRAFVKGLATVLPVALTLYLIYWLAAAAEGLVGGGIAALLPDGWYLPGLGLIVTAGLILAVGILMQAYVFRWLFGLGERLLEHLPLVKTIYGGLRDVTGFVRRMSDGHEKRLGQAVIVEFSDRLRLLGFVTRTTFDKVPDGFEVDGEETVAVYFPMSYQIGGYTTFVPRSALTPVDMPVDEAMRFAFMAGVSAEDAEEDADGPSLDVETEEEVHPRHA
jgi:uncharacterized membrane protein